MKAKKVSLNRFMYTSQGRYPGRRCELSIIGCDSLSELEERFRTEMWLDGGQNNIDNISWLWKTAANYIETQDVVTVTPLPDPPPETLHGWNGC